MENPLDRPFGKVDGFGRGDHLVSDFRVYQTGAARGFEGRADIDQWLGELPITQLRGCMGQGDFIIFREGTCGVLLKHPADSLHAERLEFGGAQSAHAAGAEHPDSLFHGIQDFLVPDRQVLGEEAVHNPDYFRVVPLDSGEQIGLSHWWQIDPVQDRPCFEEGKAWTEKDNRFHESMLLLRMARGPGRH